MRLFSTLVIIGVVLTLVGCLNPLFSRTDSELPEIQSAEPDDPLYSPGVLYDSDVTIDQYWNYTMIEMPQAWGFMHDPNFTNRFGSSVVAVIDSGYAEHNDLPPANLLIDDAWNFFDDTGNALDSGGYSNPWHGTHVAGTIATVTDNESGGSGIGWNRVRVIPLKVFPNRDPTNNDGQTITTAVVNAVLYAAGEQNSSGRVPARRVSTINMSLGGSSDNAFLAEAVEIAVARGLTVIAAAGNSGDGANTRMYPAALDSVIAVGAVGPSRRRASYSNYGDYLEFVAPGGELSGDPRDRIWSTVGETSTAYGDMIGTSMAAPHVAGVVGLMYAYNPNLTQYAVRDILRRTAVDLGASGWDQYYGFGLIDAGKALLNTPAAIGALHRTGETPLAAAGTVGGPEYEPPEPGAYLPDDATEVTPGRVMVRLQLPDTATGSERDEAVALLAAAYGAHDANRFHPLFVTMEFDPTRDVRDIVSRIFAEPTVRYAQGETRYTLLPIASTPWIP